MENPEKKPETPAGNPKFSPAQKAALWMFADAGIEFAVATLIPLLVFLFLRRHFHKQDSVMFNIIGILAALTISATTIITRINQMRKKISQNINNKPGQQ